MSNCGFTVLKNENIYLDNYNTRIIGFEDNIFGKVDKDYYKIKSTDFNIILSHEPIIADSIDNKKYGIMLSGHTHGGQIYNPFSKTHYLKGLYENVSVNQNITLFITNGVGNSIPLRFLARPEVVIIHIN